LEFFRRLFNTRLDASEQTEDLERRIEILIEDITSNIYKNTCRGLFEKHKQMYSFLNAVNINRHAGLLTDLQWFNFIKGGS
jgi:dynein heavy chain